MTYYLNSKEIIELYKKGYFPMAESALTKKINFYKPKKRFILPIYSFHIPKKLLSEFNKNKYTFIINSEFSSVIKNCSLPRKNNPETWINEIIQDIYIRLNKEGFAKSIECYHQDKLVGGLYGLHIGGCFFGESMFSFSSNSSKLCLLYLISILIQNKFHLLDSQFYNPHLLQFGAHEISDIKYQRKLKEGLDKNCIFPDFFNYEESLSTLQSLSHKS